MFGTTIRKLFFKYSVLGFGLKGQVMTGTQAKFIGSSAANQSIQGKFFSLEPPYLGFMHHDCMQYDVDVEFKGCPTSAFLRYQLILLSNHFE